MQASYRLLKGYLLRSVWLYSAVGLMQFLLTDFYWRAGVGRVGVPVALLGLWGIAAAINKYNLVWRSLPLAHRDASIFRWWAIAGAPGLWLSLCDSIAWASQRTSPGVSAPPLSSLLQNILLGWAALGVIAAAPTAARILRGRKSRMAVAFFAAYALWLIYGIPAYSASPAVAVAVWAAGGSLLAFSGIAAARGKLWRWPDIANTSSKRTARRKEGLVGPRFGIGVIVIPLLRQTLLFALEATGGMLLLYWFFPGAGTWLFWIYFISISTAGFLLTYQVRTAIPILRSLPLSTQRLAIGLQFFGAVPGFATLALALLVNAVVLHVKLDPIAFATFALIVVASQALPIPEPLGLRPITGVFVKWVRVLQRLYFPFYIGIVAVNYGGAWARWWWFRWPLMVAGVVLCFVGYYMLVRQLRAGVRPSSNEGVFSAR
jgi:hypothetical protein